MIVVHADFMEVLNTWMTGYTFHSLQGCDRAQQLSQNAMNLTLPPTPRVNWN